MILFQLRCADGHEFEAWFRDGAAYDSQCRVGAVSCPFCGDTRVGKAPMAPRLARSRGDRRDSERRANIAAEEVMRAVAKLREHVEANCDYVGDRFADEARRIHYGEGEARGIYGEATDQEASSLDEEGIEYHRLPVLPRRND